MIPFPPWRRKTAAEPVPAPSGPPAPPPEPAWQHRPPQPREAATTCGHCGEKMPEKAVDREFCSPKCGAAWQAGRADSIQKLVGPVPLLPPKAPPSPSEPAWMASWTTWETEKARLVIEARKSPTEDAA